MLGDFTSDFTSDFVHLHVASSHSMRYGASSPAVLVAQAAALGQSTLALTDRDSLGGAVRFLLACRDSGIRPIIGLDLAVAPVLNDLRQPLQRTPVRGGAEVDPRLPRVVLIARGDRGWAALCRVVTASHSADRTHPSLALPDLIDLLQQHELTGSLAVLLGPESEVARMAHQRRHDHAVRALHPWRKAFGADLRVAVVSHRARDYHHAVADSDGVRERGLPLSTAAAARLLTLAREQRVGAVLTNAVRHADPDSARVVDLLDAIRRLVPLDSRHLDRANSEGFLKSGAAMAAIAEEVCISAGAHDPRRAALGLLADTRHLAESCVLTPAVDVGLGELHVPELGVLLDPPSAHRPAPAVHSLRRRDSAVITAEAVRADAVLRARCEEGLARRHLDRGPRASAARRRLNDELAVFSTLGFAAYILTVAEVVDLIVERGIRVAARGSGAGSLVTYLLGISGVDPLEHDLLMERFCSPLRRALPDIDIDVESARRTEIYDAIIERFGPERVACVAMYDTYRVRHAIRDVGAALGLPPGEVDALAKAFPHIRARQARAALAELPELRRSGFGHMAASGQLDLVLDLVESLDGLPRHSALHPCGVLLADASLLDRTPVLPSAQGFPMSPFDKDDVEEMGFLKLDVLGIRMQSAMAYAIGEVARVDGASAQGRGSATLLPDGRINLDTLPRDDPDTFELIRSTRTLGCFQIESPGQRELLGKFAPETFDDLIIDISLFRPGPMKSDMITPFLRARQGWSMPAYLHDDLRPVLAQTRGVVVFHEQVLRMVSITTGCSLAEADEVRRRLGSTEGQNEMRGWYYPAALARGYSLAEVEAFWDVLAAFASFGFCKAHSAAFALPTYQSAWLKAHHPAAFLAGVLTHDPGMYPKRLILDDARQCGVVILGLDINRSSAEYRVEKTEQGYGIRLSLAEVRGISDDEVARIVAGQPYAALADFWHRVAVARPVVERLVLTGAFDAVHGISAASTATGRRGRATRRDLLLSVADLDRWSRSSSKSTTSTTSSSQLTLDLGDYPDQVGVSGLPELTDHERVQAELSVLGLDVSGHVLNPLLPLMRALGVTRSPHLLRTRSRQEVLVAGVKVATQTPPVRSGRRVIFLTLDDAAGPVDATFFEDAQGPFAETLFHSWMLLVRGEVRRTGPRGVSIRATGCWELTRVDTLWRSQGLPAVMAMLNEQQPDITTEPRRVLVHPSGFRQSPYADLRPAGESVAKMWHSSPGSSGW